jgi:tetratricopeptide (TPR) repeat protein
VAVQEFASVLSGLAESFARRHPLDEEDLDKNYATLREAATKARFEVPRQTHSLVGASYELSAERLPWDKTSDKADFLRRAVAAYRAGVGSFGSGDGHAIADLHRRLGDVHWDLANLEEPRKNCRAAIGAYREALKVYTLDAFPMDYAMTQNNLGAAYGTLAEVEEKAANCRAAIGAYREALKVYTEDVSKQMRHLIRSKLQRAERFCKGEK